MENLNTNELIERYLSGSLPSAEEQEVETRIVEDPAFLAAVELHQQLNTEFSDPKKLRLRDLLGEITRETAPGNYNWVKWLGIILIVTFVAGLLWYRSSPVTPGLPVQEENKLIPQSDKPVVTPGNPGAPSDPLKKSPDRPIAMADPAAFVPNREFEDRLGSQIRATDGSAEMHSPVTGAHFIPEKGSVKIQFRGAAAASSDTAQFPLILNIYSNRISSAQPLLRLSPVIQNRGTTAEKWIFSVSQRLRLQQGLYYFTLERRANEDLIFVGKFTVQSR